MPDQGNPRMPSPFLKGARRRDPADFPRSAGSIFHTRFRALPTLTAPPPESSGNRDGYSLHDPGSSAEPRQARRSSPADYPVLPRANADGLQRRGDPPTNRRRLAMSLFSRRFLASVFCAGGSWPPLTLRRRSIASWERSSNLSGDVSPECAGLSGRRPPGAVSRFQVASTTASPAAR